MHKLMLFSILLIALFLDVYYIHEFLHFIGDQAWFYLSARDMLLTGNIPLVGITSSHPWLHQGAYWTYLLAGGMLLLGYSPFVGAYISILLGLVTVLLMYKIGSIMFSRRVGLIAALLYATAPLAVIYVRVPYHTSPIPLLALLFIFFLYKWIKGNTYYFPLVIFLLAVLYNFEIAAVLLAFVFIILWVFGLWTKKKWAIEILSFKSLALSFIAFVIPMMPMLIYDFSHGFSQTLKVIAWMGYQIMKMFGFASIHGYEENKNTLAFLQFTFEQYKRLVFVANGFGAFIIFVLSFSFFFVDTYLMVVKKKKVNFAYIVLALCLAIPLMGYLVSRVSSHAYLFIFFPSVIFITALMFDKFVQVKKLFFSTIVILCIVALLNGYYLIKSNYFFDKGKLITFSERLDIVKQIKMRTKGKPYNLVGKGPQSKFESYVMNYEYLLWWLGHPQSEQKLKYKIVILEDSNGVTFGEEYYNYVR